MRLEPLVRLGTHGRQIEATGQIVVTGAHEPRLLLQTFNDGLLNLARETATGAEIHQAEAGHIQPFGQRGEGCKFIFQRGDRLGDAHFRRTVAVSQLADHCQQRHFPHDHFPPRTFKANIQLAVLVGHGDLLRLIAEITQPVQVIGFKERQARKPLVFIVLQRQMLHRIDLFTNGVCVDTEQIVTTAAEFRRDVNVIVMVENGLLHMQFIRVGIQQRMQNRRSELSHRCAVASSHGSV